MAKKRKGKIKISLSTQDNNNVVQFSEHGLPAYHHFVDAPDHSFRLFFEDLQSLDEIKDPKRNGKRFLRKPSGHNPFRIMAEGKRLVGEDIARTFALLISKKILNNAITNKLKPLDKEHTTVKSFFDYLASLNEQPLLFSDVRATHISGWLSQAHKGSSGTYRLTMKGLLDLHPLSNELSITDIRCQQKVSKSTKLSQMDFDEIVKSKDYSEKVHFQILAFVFFEIENAEERLKTFEQANSECLDGDYIQSDRLNTKNPIVRQLLESGEESFKKLRYHLYFYLEHPSNKEQNTRASKFLSRLREINDILFKESESPGENFEKFKAYLHLSEQNNWPLKEGANSPTMVYMGLRSKHHELAIFVYSLITLGINKEVALSWKWEVNGKPWYENYDVELGINHKSVARDKKIVLVGIKKKGRTPIVVKKSISTNSPLFNYLKFLDKTRGADRKYIFNFGDVVSYMTAFLRHYPVIDDDGNRLKTIETQKLRKSYLGYKTLSLLEGVKNSNDVISKLREALNHKSFDTTFSSYIMKSGMARTIVDSAIVALTSNMLENAVRFSGEIKEENERSEDNEVVFLCDCTDPSAPSHGLPINDKCTKYDMCLGCDRSEVYSEHLPAIYFRILQYEEKQVEAPDIFKVTLEDRLQIARDTVEQFKFKHSNGMEIVEQAYLIASQAMLNNEPLLPPILQTGGL